MQDDTADLENFARQAASSGEPYWIEVVDLRDLPVDDPDALDNAVATVLREYVSRSISRFFHLPDRRLVIVADVGHGRQIDRGLRALSEDLQERHDGRLVTTPYLLPRDVQSFLTFCGRELQFAKEQAEARDGDRPAGVRTWGRRLSDAVRTAHTLVHADLSAYVHELPVIDLAQPDADEAVMAVELAPSFSEVAQALRVPVDADAWLARHLAGLIHGRVIQQVRDEPGRLRHRLHLNALPETVLSNQFDAFTRGLDPWERHRITIEIPTETAIAEPTDLDRTRQTLITAGFSMGLDAADPAALAQAPALLDLAATVKVAGGRDALTRHARTLQQLISEHPNPAWILLDAHDAATRQAAAELGFAGAQARTAA